uniref:S-phase kinase associated protein 2 n=1 Tax=Pipistrellus kuhlii TaxID=59472 RepID=A0A7J7YYS9_PIPKU|nr:S-phase kinase associated protein 2 [Pipistrellus kuhlii]
MHRKHLQEIPDQSSNVATNFTWGWDSSKTSELLSGMGVSSLEKERADSENIPQELLSNLGHPQGSPRKRLRSKGNDKDFVIIRRPKLNRENFPASLISVFSLRPVEAEGRRISDGESVVSSQKGRKPALLPLHTTWPSHPWMEPRLLKHTEHSGCEQSEGQF